MSDFAQEVAASKPSRTPAPTTETAPLLTGGPEDMNTTAPEPTPAPAPTPEPVAAKAAQIRIGTEVFDNPEDAIKYATELQLELAKKDAFDQGRAAAQPAAPAAPTKDEFDELEEKIFENPKETIKKIVELAEKNASKKIAETQARERAINETWQGFYSQNQDLVENKDLVDFVMQKNWNEIGNLPVEKSLKILAEKTRALLSSRKVSALPTTELPSAPAVTTAASSTATTPVKEKVDNPVDFISQVNKHRKRG